MQPSRRAFLLGRRPRQSSWAAFIYIHVVVPVAWALAEERGLRLNDVIVAVTIGNEIAGRTSRAIQRGAYLGNGLPNH